MSVGPGFEVGIDRYGVDIGIVVERLKGEFAMDTSGIVSLGVCAELCLTVVKIGGCHC